MEKSFTHLFTAPLATMASTRISQNHSTDLHPGLPCDWQDWTNTQASFFWFFSLVGSLVISRIAVCETIAHMGCQQHRGLLYLLHCNDGLQNKLFLCSIIFASNIHHLTLLISISIIYIYHVCGCIHI